MEQPLDRRRILIFLVFAFGIAWLTAIAIYLTGGLANSLKIGGVAPLALILLSGPFMAAPALANVFTRIVTREGWQNVWLRPNFRKGWRFWAAAWFLPGLLTLLGAAVYYLVVPGNFDPQLGLVQSMLAGTPAEGKITPLAVALLQVGQALLLAPLVNGLFTFGEEFGWRGYLMPKLMALGPRKALLATAVIWGVWHWPVIFMGYEYGFKYAGYPVLGPLLFCWITFGFGTILSWLAWRGRSVWPAVIGHAAINGIAGVSALALQGQPLMLLGPTPVGVLGTLAFSVLALGLFVRSTAWAVDGQP